MADIKQVADAADMIVRSRCFWLPFGLPVFILSSFCTGRGSSAVVFYKKKKEKSMQK